MIEHVYGIPTLIPDPPTTSKKKEAILCDARCSLTSLFDQASKFSSEHSWYKMRGTEIVYVLLQPYDDGLGWKLAVCKLEEDDEEEGRIEMRQRAFALNADHYEPGDVPECMIEHSKKYPIKISSDLGGDGYTLPNPSSARCIFDKYMWYLKKEGLASPESINLPQFNPDTMSSIPDSFRPSRYGSHEKWRIIGHIVNAACSLATDCGIKLDYTTPYPIDSACLMFEDDRMVL